MAHKIQEKITIILYELYDSGTYSVLSVGSPTWRSLPSCYMLTQLVKSAEGVLVGDWKNIKQPTARIMIHFRSYFNNLTTAQNHVSQED